MASVMSGLMAAAPARPPQLGARVLHLHRQQPVDLSRYRPRQGAGAGPEHVRRVHRAAGHAGRHLRQRLQPVRPHLAGQHPGRGVRPQRHPRDLADLRAQQDRRRWCRCARSPICASCSGRRSSAATTTTAPSRSTARRRRASPPATRWRRWPQVSAHTLPPGYTFEWTGTAYQEVAASGQTGASSALAVLFAYLFLVALYESWVIPIPVLLSVTVGVLGAFVGIWSGRPAARPLCADRPGGADRAGRQERHPDRRVRQGPARGAACRSSRPRRWARGMRFRAVMMTSIAFILGLVPLVIATGAAMLSRRAVGTAVFAGMIGASCDRHLPDPDALRHLPDQPRMGLGAVRQSGLYPAPEPRPPDLPGPHTGACNRPLHRASNRGSWPPH